MYIFQLLHFLVVMLRCRLRLPSENDAWFVFPPICFVGGSYFLLYVIFYLPTFTNVQHDFYIRRWFTSFNSNTTVKLEHQELLTFPVHEFTPIITLCCLSFSLKEGKAMHVTQKYMAAYNKTFETKMKSIICWQRIMEVLHKI